MDKDQVYYVLTNCGLPNRTIKVHIEDVYNPPKVLSNIVTSDIHHIQDIGLFDVSTGDMLVNTEDKEYLKDLRFEYDLRDELVYIYYKTNLDPKERLLYALTKKYIENHFEPIKDHIKVDVDLTLPGQEKLPENSGTLQRFKTYVKNTNLTAIELKKNILQRGYRFHGGKNISGDVHLREWKMQAYLRIDTMCYDATEEFNECFITFKYFFDSDIAYFKFWNKDNTDGYDIAFKREDLENLGIRVFENNEFIGY